VCPLAHSRDEQEAARAQMSQMNKADIDMLKASAKEKKAREQEKCKKAAEEADQSKVTNIEPLDETAESAAESAQWDTFEIDIPELVNKCARGEAVNRGKTSWADMSDDFSSDEDNVSWSKASPSSRITSTKSSAGVIYVAPRPRKAVTKVKWCSRDFSVSITRPGALGSLPSC